MNPTWFILCRKPEQNLSNDTSKKKSSRYVLTKIPFPHSPLVDFSGRGLVVVGSSIYNIARSSVSILDCMSLTWREAPSLRKKLLSLTASVVDHKIYVAGWYNDGDLHSSKDWIEVFDTKTHIWEPLPIPSSERKCNFHLRSACTDGKFHLKSNRDALAYNYKERRWVLVEQGGMFRHSKSCEIENVLYYVSHSGFKWYDSEVSTWRDLKGLVGLPNFPYDARVKLVDYGGKMAVLWDDGLAGIFEKHTVIWCVEIVLERRKVCGKFDSEIWGYVEWFDHVLTVPGKCDVVKVLAASV